MQKPIIQNDRDQRVYLYPEHPAPLPIPRASRALSAAFCIYAAYLLTAG